MPRRPAPPAAVFRLADAGRRAWWRLRRPQLRGAFVLVRLGDAVLLVRNGYRRGHGLPGGGVKRSEGPAAAALRELREEVGIRLAPAALRYGGTLVYEHFGCIDTISFFEAEVDAAPAIEVDGWEVTWAGFVPIVELSGVQISTPVRLYLEGRGLLPSACRP